MERRWFPAFEILVGPMWRIWLALCYLSLPSAGTAADAIASFDCEAGVCGFNVLDPALLVEPCKDRSVLVAYSESGGAVLLQCASDENSSENLGYLFDRNRSQGLAVELAGIRFVKASVLAGAAENGIPDRFGAIPLCISPTPAHEGDLLMVAKQPRPGSDAAYCYRLLRVASARDGLEIRTDDMAALPAMPPRPDVWAVLQNKLLPFVGPTRLSRPQEHVARVTRKKAALYAEPNANTKSRMYLVRGDTILVLDNSKRDFGWVKIRYVTRSGRQIDNWMNAADLDLTGHSARVP